MVLGAKNRTPPRPDTPTRRLEMPRRLMLLQLGRSDHTRQSHISRQRFRRRRLQQSRHKLQRDEAGKHDGATFGRKPPANA